jgi:hypothetical protein
MVCNKKFYYENKKEVIKIIMKTLSFHLYLAQLHLKTTQGFIIQSHMNFSYV